MLKKAFSSFLQLCKTRWAYVVSLVFIWVIPIIMLNEYVALTETNIAFKITFMGCLVIFVIFLAMRKKIYAFIHKQPHGLTRGVLLCVHKAITYGLALGILWAISYFSGKFFHWWLLCGISILIGLVFIIVDEILAARKKKEGGPDETVKN